MFLDWKNQHCENDYTTQSNLQIQCNLYQTTNGIFHRSRAKNFTICMEIQKTPNRRSNLEEKKKRSWMGFPGGAVVENLPANAGDMSSSPGLGRSHMPRSSWAREPQLLSLHIWSLCSATGGAATVKGPCTAMSGPHTAMKSGPRLPQLEKALARTEDPTQPKINK